IVLSLGETSLLDECPTSTFPAERPGREVLAVVPAAASLPERADEALAGTTLAPTLDPSENTRPSAPKSSTAPIAKVRRLRITEIPFAFRQARHGPDSLRMLRRDEAHVNAPPGPPWVWPRPTRDEALTTAASGARPPGLGH